jgi:hypothetical protein
MTIKKARIIFITFVIVVLTLGLARVVIKNINGEPRYASSARIEQLKLCNEAYPSSGIPTSVHICGNVDIGPNEIALLEIYLFKMPEKDLVSRNPHDDIFYNGPFSRELKLKDSDYLGNYKVEIYLFREVISSLDFKVK